MQTIAAIDIGTQTIRLLIAEIDSRNRLYPLYRDRIIARLGQGTSKRDKLLKTSINRATECIKDFISRARDFNCDKIVPAATACVREAANQNEFIDHVFSETGMTINVLTGDMEARLTLDGVKSVIDNRPECYIVMDIGGGSTEFVYETDNQHIRIESLPAGVLRLAEKHLKHDPPLKSEVANIQKDISSILESSSIISGQPTSADPASLCLIATAGTATTLASLNLSLQEYEPSLINGHRLEYGFIERLFMELIAETTSQRASRPGLETGRATVIIPGTAIILSVMDRLSLNELIVSDAGLLEGIILHHDSNL